MLGHGHDVLRAGGLEERGPVFRVVVRHGEQRDEVLVAELVGRPIVLGVPLHVGGVHVPDVPLVDARRDRVKPPVDEDAELGRIEPRRGVVQVADRGPGRFERAVELGLGLGVGVGRARRCSGLRMQSAGKKGGRGGEQRGLGKEAAAAERHV